MYNDRPVTKVSSGELNRDSTDSKKAELALAISEEKLLQEYQLTEKGSDMLRLGLLGTGMTKRPEKGLN